jgi:UDP-GlcNAc:undecaprenyl-phosphate GlcNAc-1-phosphate transferase
MLHLVPVLFVALAIAAIVTPVVRNIANALKLLDRNGDSRRVHRRAVPRLGGVAIVVAFNGSLALGVVIFPAVREVVSRSPWMVLGLCAAGTVLALLGLYDDLLGAGARKKLLIQGAAGLILYGVGFRLETIAIPFGPALELGMLSLPLTMLWVATVTNSINLIDGLDGLAGGVAAIGALAALLIAADAGDALGVVIALALAGSAVGFLAYNVHPASLFMGDTGSLFLGMVLSVFALRPGFGGAKFAPLAMGVVLAVPILDTIAAVARRAVRGAPICSGDREHLHHRLLDRGMSHRGAVHALWLATSAFAAAGVVIASSPSGRTTACLVAVLGGGVLLATLHALEWPTAATLSRRRTNRQRLRAVRELSARLSCATGMDEVEHAAAAAARFLGAQAVRVHSMCVIDSSPPGNNGVTTRTFFPVPSVIVDRCALEVEWKGPPARPDRDTEVAIELLCRSIGAALDHAESSNRPPLQ